MLAVIVLCAICILLFVSLASIIVQQRHQIESLSRNQTIADDRSASTTTTVDPIQVNVKRKEEQERSFCLTPDCVKVAASVIEAIDLTVNPCDDFYVSSALANLPLELNIDCLTRAS